MCAFRVRWNKCGLSVMRIKPYCFPYKWDVRRVIFYRQKECFRKGSFHLSDMEQTSLLFILGVALGLHVQFYHTECGVSITASHNHMFKHIWGSAVNRIFQNKSMFIAQKTFSCLCFFFHNWKSNNARSERLPHQEGRIWYWGPLVKNNLLRYFCFKFPNWLI